jgi:hypothetical protein
MVAKRKTSRSELKKRVRKAEADLARLEAGHPQFNKQKKVLEQEIRLARAELKTAKRPASKNTATAKSGTTAKRKRPPLPGGASFPSFQLPSPKSPTFYEDSVKTMGSLRNLCKQGLTYMQRADQLFDGLHGFGSHLHQTGVLPKIAKGKLKDMTTGEWSALLMALLNSPLSGFLLGGGPGTGGGGQAPAEQTEAAQQGDGK